MTQGFKPRGMKPFLLAKSSFKVCGILSPKNSNSMMFEE
ncbi:hypothetical protein L581_0596 [Serratia fonticola AU-AP2C]|nr:hypothetical protein L581_0596 [Serratia fonticola AU-AP2C]